MIPQKWNSLGALTEFLRHKDSGEIIRRMNQVVASQLDHIWSLLPPQACYLLGTHGAWYDRSPAAQECARDQIVDNAYYDGRWKDTPDELAHRLLIYRLVFSQCVKKGHSLYVS